MRNRIGEQIGNYRLIRLLGQGTFGEVYQGEHIYLKTYAAIKLLHMHLNEHETQHFLGEAQIIAQLEHPHIVRLLDFGIDRNLPFFVMTYAPNGTLRHRHPRGTRISLTTVVNYTKQIATALQYAHDNKLIHRDIKPENILLGRNDEILLSDFGIAVTSQSMDSRNIQDIAGTAVYMAPEQFQGSPRRASDQYALGVIIYEWLCGKCPFQGTFPELLAQHISTTPPPLHVHNPAISADIEHVVLTSLAKDPQDRFGSVQAFARAFEQACYPMATQTFEMAEPLPSQSPPQEPASDHTPPTIFQKKELWVLGIDLGTTNSVMAVIVDGKPVIIPNAEGALITPSVVAFNKKDELLVGEPARRQAIANPENTIFSIKRFIGRKYSDPQVEQDRRFLPYKIVRASNSNAAIEIRGREYSPVEISAMILQKIKRDAEVYIGSPITMAVITVPAHFNAIQRRAIKDAAKLANLDVTRVINEPTAASLAYGLDRKGDERIAVYSFGGGTFDISLLELGDGVFEVKSSIGDPHLGGDDFDQRLMTWVADEFYRMERIDLRQDYMALPRLKEAVEKAKKELSSVMQTEINLPYITVGSNGPKHLVMTLSRSKLEQLVGDLIEKSRDPIMQALSDAGIGPTDIHEIILTGGQTRMPAIQSLIQRIFNRAPRRSINPDEAVAIGAAIQSAVLTGDIKDILLLDVLPASLSIETLDGNCVRMIERNTTIPTQKSQVFSTVVDNQFAVDIHILQGEQKLAKENDSIGFFRFEGIHPAPKGVPQIEIILDIDANSIINARACDKGTGREQRITIVTPGGPSKEEVASFMPPSLSQPSTPPPEQKEIK